MVLLDAPPKVVHRIGRAVLDELVVAPADRGVVDPEGFLAKLVFGAEEDPRRHHARQELLIDDESRRRVTREERPLYCIPIATCCVSPVAFRWPHQQFKHDRHHLFHVEAVAGERRRRGRRIADPSHSAE